MERIGDYIDISVHPIIHIHPNILELGVTRIDTFHQIKILINTEFLSEDVVDITIKHGDRFYSDNKYENMINNLLKIGTLLCFDFYKSKNEYAKYISKKWNLDETRLIDFFKHDKKNVNKKRDKTYLFYKLVELFKSFCESHLTKLSLKLSKLTKNQTSANKSYYYEFSSYWNIYVVKLRSIDKVFWYMPTLDPKSPRKFKGGVREVMNNRVDLMVGLEIEESLQPISICGHKTTNKSYPCWISDKNTLFEYIKSVMSDSSKFNICTHMINSIMDQIRLSSKNNFVHPIPLHRHGIDEGVSIKISEKTMQLILKSISLKCPMQRTEHCTKGRGKSWHDDNDIFCSNNIAMSKIISFFDKDQRSYIRDKIYDLMFRICEMHHNRLIYYCNNNKCMMSHEGFLYDDEIDKELHPENTHIMCLKCNHSHYIHQHKIRCILCDYSFCNACQMSPYHDMQKCKGPANKLIDPDISLVLSNDPSLKRCPNCNFVVEITGGCDHIKCKCGIDWCYRCEKRLNKDNPYQHKCIPESLLSGNISKLYYTTTR